MFRSSYAYAVLMSQLRTQVTQAQGNQPVITHCDPEFCENITNKLADYERSQTTLTTVDELHAEAMKQCPVLCDISTKEFKNSNKKYLAKKTSDEKLVFSQLLNSP